MSVVVVMEHRRPLGMLCRKYDTGIVFSQMIMVDSVVMSAKAALVGEMDPEHQRGV